MRASRLLWLILAAAPVRAVPQLECVVNSAPGAGAVAVVNCDCPGTDSTDNPTVRLFYSLDYQSTWTELEMEHIGTPGYGSTFEQQLTVPGSGGVFYYVRAEYGPNFVTQSPFNGANAWPPGEALMAKVANEPVGDTINGARAWLDLTEVRLGHSDDYLYFSLSNNHNSWPIGSFPGPWYVYSVGFKNPEAPSDTWVYVISYCNVMGLYTSGLYEINQLTEAYTKLTNIDAVTDGNRLVMRCRFSDFASRSHFGPWPNQSGSLYKIQGSTQSVTMSQQHYNHDTTAHCRLQVDRTPFSVVGQNHPPMATDAGVMPASGTQETDFDFSCRYSDPDSNLPIVRAVIVDAETLDITPDHHRYWDGVEFRLIRRGFSPGWHRFHFAFDDGMASTQSSLDSFHVSSAGINGPVESCLSPLRAEPNPFVDRLEFLLPAGSRRLALYDACGRSVRNIPVARTGAGDAESTIPLVLDGRDLVPGIYFCRTDDQRGPVVRLVKAGP